MSTAFGPLQSQPCVFIHAVSPALEFRLRNKTHTDEPTPTVMGPSEGRASVGSPVRSHSSPLQSETIL